MPCGSFLPDIFFVSMPTSLSLTRAKPGKTKMSTTISNTTDTINMKITELPVRSISAMFHSLLLQIRLNIFSGLRKPSIVSI